MRGAIAKRVVRAQTSVAPELAAICCVVALIWWGIAGTLLNQRANALETAANDTANLAHAFQENTQRIVAGGDQVLLALRAEFVRDGTNFNLNDWVKHESAPDWLTAQIAVIGPDGMSIASTASKTKVSVADREHFIVQKRSKADHLFISKPVLGRSSGRWTIQLTRKIMGANGDFAGVVVLSVDCYQLSGFYETLRLRQGYIELFGDDGIVRARGPFEPSAIGSRVRLYGPTASFLRDSDGTFRAHDGRDMLTVSYRRLPAYPLVVEVAFSDKTVLAPFRHARKSTIWSGSIATLFIVALGFAWIRQRKRSIESQNALALTLESMDQGLVMIDSGERIRVLNERALQLLGLPLDMMTAVRPGMPLKREAVEREIMGVLRDWLSARAHRSSPIDGRILEANTSPIAAGGAVHTITDVTARHLADQRIRHMALHDHLTGLANRASFADEADHLIATSAQTRDPFGILCLDLDGFKKVNDTFGHDGGDELLREVARRLTAVVPTGDIVARSGGDEFAILLQCSNQPEASEEVAASIIKCMEAPFAVTGQHVRLGVCIGIAVFPTSGLTRAELLRNADLALYAAKANRKSPIRLFEPGMADHAHDRLLLEEEMRTAIETDEFYLHYQPQFRTSSLELVGFEALVRWNHPTRGQMRPDVFIPLAEETGLIVVLGQQILERACRAALGWPSDIRIAVNLSPVQVRDPNLVHAVKSVLAATGLSPSRLELEVTEGVLISDEQQAFEKLSTLRELGVTVALDDFGTGYSSLSYLRKFPFDTIKLDRSFVQAQVLEDRSRAILRFVLSLSRSLRLNVIAEGVETRTQLRLLREQRCPVVQGFLVGRPMPEQDTLKMMFGTGPLDESAATRAVAQYAPNVMRQLTQ